MIGHKTIVLCKYCGKPEYWGEFRWLSGKMVCRACYKAEFERETGKPYKWTDLNGHVPTMEEYTKEGGDAVCRDN